MEINCRVNISRLGNTIIYKRVTAVLLTCSQLKVLQSTRASERHSKNGNQVARIRLFRRLSEDLKYSRVLRKMTSL